MSNIFSDELIYKGREATDEFLAHHGVLGMKWGIRKDGKPQGWQGGAKKAAKVVGSGTKKVAKGTVKAAKFTAKTAIKGRAKIKEIQARKNEKKAKEEARLNELKLEDKKRREEASYSIAATTRSARSLSKHMGSLTDAELDRRINRLRKENEVREMAAKERERGRSWISKSLENSAKTSFSNVTTYGLTKMGKTAVDKLLEGAISGSDNKDSSSGNGILDTKSSSSSKSSSGKSSSSNEELNKYANQYINMKSNAKGAKGYNKPTGKVKSNKRNSRSYGVSKLGDIKYNSKAYGTSQPVESKTFSFGDVAYDDLFDD